MAHPEREIYEQNGTQNENQQQLPADDLEIFNDLVSQARQIWQQRLGEPEFEAMAAETSVKFVKIFQLVHSGHLSPENIASLLATTFTDAHLQAEHDAQTGLLRKGVLLRRVQTAVNTAQRTQSTVSAAMIDLDDFKEINDTYGHQAGDRLIVITAAKLLSQMREEDPIGRYGGDEFAVVLSDTNTRQARTIFQRVLNNIPRATTTEFNATQPEKNLITPVSMSVGISSTDLVGYDSDALIESADSALRRAKRSGKNKIEIARRKRTQ